MRGKPRTTSSLFTLAAIVTAIAALHFAREILLPIALAILFSFLLSPLADRLERWRLGRIPSVLAVVCAAFLALGLLGWVVTSQLVDLSSNLPKYRENIIAKVKAVTNSSGALREVTQTIEDVQKEIAREEPEQGEATGESADQPKGEGVGPPLGAPGGSDAGAPNGGGSAPAEFAAWAERVFGPRNAGAADAVEVKVVSLPPSPLSQVQTWLGPLTAPLTAAGMVVVLVLFMLLQREDQRNRLIRLFGTDNIHATTEALSDIVERVSKYLRMQFLINAGYGLCVGIGLAAIGLPNAVMFGVLSFSLRFLPYIGPWISATLPVAVALASTDGWGPVSMVVGLFVVLELIVNNVAEPLLYGNSTGVSGIGVIVAAIFWTWLWGAIGLVMAMPLTVCLVVMARYIPALRFITVMLGDEPTLTLEERTYQRMLAGDDDEVSELAEEFLSHATPTEFYDRVLIPSMRLAEQDRHDGVLSEDQDQVVQEVARERISEVGKRSKGAADEAIEQQPADAATTASRPSRGRVLCIPLRDEGDLTAGMMLSQLLAEHDIECQLAATSALTSERVEAVASSNADMVVVSVLPPLPQRDSRLLCRRLRKQYASLPILVGFWKGDIRLDSGELLAAKDDAEIVTSLAEAVERIRAIASRPVDEMRAPAIANSAAVGAKQLAAREAG